MILISYSLTWTQRTGNVSHGRNCLLHLKALWVLFKIRLKLWSETDLLHLMVSLLVSLNLRLMPREVYPTTQVWADLEIPTLKLVLVCLKSSKGLMKATKTTSTLMEQLKPPVTLRTLESKFSKSAAPSMLSWKNLVKSSLDKAIKWLKTISWESASCMSLQASTLILSSDLLSLIWLTNAKDSRTKICVLRTLKTVSFLLLPSRINLCLARPMSRITILLVTLSAINKTKLTWKLVKFSSKRDKKTAKAMFPL